MEAPPDAAARRKAEAAMAYAAGRLAHFDAASHAAIAAEGGSRGASCLPPEPGARR